MEGVVRTAESVDAAQIARVHTAAWRWAYRGQMPDTFLDNLSAERRIGVWETSIKASDEAVLVAEIDSGLVGFVSVGLRRDAPHGEVVGATDAAEAELYAIYLLEAWTGCGLGRRLMTAGEEAMRALGAKRAFLWVLASNTATHRFYEAAGWHQDGNTATYDIGGEGLEVLRYTKDLETSLEAEDPAQGPGPLE
jgi:GNAT superfamily N-acetyltransferase